MAQAKLVEALDAATSLAQVFEVVKRAVRGVLGEERAGLMLALADLGNHPQGFLGAFHFAGSNYVVVNKNPLRRLRDTTPEWFNAYAFHVLLHEYLHSLGHVGEAETRRLCLAVSRGALGEGHVATRMAHDIAPFMPGLVYPEFGWQPERLVLEIDREFGIRDASYIH